MMDGTSLRRSRCLAVWTAVTGAGLALVDLLAGDLRPRPGAAFDEVVVAGAAWALCAAVAWASLVTGVVAFEAAAAGGARAQERAAPIVRGVPEPVRRVVLRACGVALAGSLTAAAVGPAAATPGAPAPPTGPVSADPVSADPVSADPVSAGSLAHATVSGERVTTRPGDSLWLVAEAELRAATGRMPSDAEVAAYWPRIHATNRVLVGPDPDFILPGVPLVLPAADPQHAPIPDEEQS